MPKQDTIIGSPEDLRFLVGHIARMPDVDPPRGLTEAVMRRIGPKRISGRRKWMRLIRTPWAILPMQAVPVGVTLVLILAGIAFVTGFNSGRDSLPIGPEVSAVGGKAVPFALNWPTAHKVAIVGSFNHWNPDGHQMHRDAPNAPWQLSLELAQGEYAYAFLIDDQWLVPDPNSLWQQDDGFGNLNSGLIVEDGKQNANQI